MIDDWKIVENTHFHFYLIFNYFVHNIKIHILVIRSIKFVLYTYDCCFSFSSRKYGTKVHVILYADFCNNMLIKTDS